MDAETIEEDVSLATIKGMLRAAESRLRNLNRGDALDAVRRAAHSCNNAMNCVSSDDMEMLHEKVVELQAAIGDRADKVELSYKHNEWEGREAAIGLLLDITKTLKRSLIFVEHGFDGTSISIDTARGCIFPAMPQVISDIVSIYGILAYYLPRKDSMDSLLFENRPLLKSRLVRLGMHYTESSPWVEEAAEEGFVALAEMALDRAANIPNKTFENMAAFIIEIAEKNGLLSRWSSRMSHPRFSARVEAMVDELDGGRNKDGLAVDAPAFAKRPVPKPETAAGKTPKPVRG